MIFKKEICWILPYRHHVKTMMYQVEYEMSNKSRTNMKSDDDGVSNHLASSSPI